MLIFGGFGPTQKGGMYCVSDQPNGAPLAMADAVNARSGKRLTVGLADSVLANDSDPNGDFMSARLTSGPSNGKLEFHANGTFSYTAKKGYKGADSFSYVANDDLLDSAPALVQITVK